jgi:hypothetical protein
MEYSKATRPPSHAPSLSPSFLSEMISRVFLVEPSRFQNLTAAFHLSYHLFLFSIATKKLNIFDNGEKKLFALEARSVGHAAAAVSGSVGSNLVRGPILRVHKYFRRNFLPKMAFLPKLLLKYWIIHMYNIGGYEKRHFFPEIDENRRK